MKIITSIPKEVYNLIISNGRVESINMDREDKYQAKIHERYNILKEFSGFDNFFFGGVAFNKDEFFNNEELFEMVDNCNLENDTVLELEVPRELLFLSDYDVFTEYIFSIEDKKSGFETPNLIRWELYLEKGITFGERIQAIFPYIDSSWIVSVCN